MKSIIQFAMAWLLCLPPAHGQSPAEAAKKEAERRKAIDDKGVEAKVIRKDSLQRLSPGNLITNSAPPSTVDISRREPAPKGRATAASYRTALARLDGEIRRCEEPLVALKNRYEAERHVIARSGKSARNPGVSPAQERLALRVQETEAKLKRLRRERLETYDAGQDRIPAGGIGRAEGLEIDFGQPADLVFGIFANTEQIDKLAGSQEVAGSILASSTNKIKACMANC